MLGALPLVAAAACGSSSGSASLPVCTPGQSVACVGTGGCSGGQVCAADGQAFGACACGSVNDGGGSDAEPSADASRDAGGDAAAEAGSDAAVDAPPEAAIDAGMLSPGSLGSGLVLWLDDAIGSIVSGGYGVSTWKDQSGHGFDVSSYMPLAQGPIAEPNVLNGHTILFFQGQMADLYTMAPLTGVDFAGDYLVEIVADVAGSTNGSVWSAIDGVGEVRMAPTASGVAVSDVSNPGLLDGGPIPQVSLPASASTFHILGMRRKGMPATLEARVDGSSHSTSDAFPFVANPAGEFDVGDELSGRIAEIVVYTGTLTDLNVLAIEGYLKAKYALP